MSGLRSVNFATILQTLIQSQYIRIFLTGSLDIDFCWGVVFYLFVFLTDGSCDTTQSSHLYYYGFKNTMNSDIMVLVTWSTHLFGDTVIRSSLSSLNHVFGVFWWVFCVSKHNLQHSNMTWELRRTIWKIKLFFIIFHICRLFLIYIYIYNTCYYIGFVFYIV